MWNKNFRAKSLLIVIGDAFLLSQEGSIWKKIIKFCKSKVSKN